MRSCASNFAIVICQIEIAAKSRNGSTYIHIFTYLFLSTPSSRVKCITVRLIYNKFVIIVRFGLTKSRPHSPGTMTARSVQSCSTTANNRRVAPSILNLSIVLKSLLKCMGIYTVARYGQAAHFFTSRAHVNHIYVRTSSSNLTCARGPYSRAHVEFHMRT